MLSIPKYPEQYAQHFPTIFYLLRCASQHHVMEPFAIVTFDKKYVAAPPSQTTTDARHKGVSTHARALGLQKDGWSCGYEWLRLCDEVVGHQGSLEDIDGILIPLPKDSSRKHRASSMRIAPSESQRMDGRRK